MAGGKTTRRCNWAGEDRLYVEYHDREWGVPVHDDRRLFEMLVLEGAQAGLSWITILRKREAYRAAFAGFDAVEVARFTSRKVSSLMRNAGIVRNRAKIEATIRNARAFLQLQSEFGSFAAYVWRFVGGRPKKNAWRTQRQVPAKTAESESLSRDLKQRGFGFVGPRIQVDIFALPATHEVEVLEDRLVFVVGPRSEMRSVIRPAEVTSHFDRLHVSPSRRPSPGEF